MQGMFIINTIKKEYVAFNGMPCKVVNANRDDGLVEVQVLDTKHFILLEPMELDDQLKKKVVNIFVMIVIKKGDYNL